MKKSIALLSLFWCSCHLLTAPVDICVGHPGGRGVYMTEIIPDEPFVFMFYNVENLFDTYDDSLKDDGEFLPGGSRGWTYNRYYNKLTSIAKVILSAGGWDPPALVGLCETENRGVAEALIRLTPLSNFNYGVVYIESDDIRGIDVCLIYDRNKFEIDTYRVIRPALEGDRPAFVSRPILYVKLKKGEAYLHLMLNHWPSRRGGVLAGFDMRYKLAESVRYVADSLFLNDGTGSALIVAGDFNCDPSGAEIRLISDGGLVNLAMPAYRQGRGTYRYRGVWQMFDQIIVSESMINSGSSFSAGEFSVHSPEFLLTDDPVYPGKKPFSTYDAFRYSGGYSDHLPVLVRLSAR